MLLFESKCFFKIHLYIYNIAKAMLNSNYLHVRYKKNYKKKDNI